MKLNQAEVLIIGVIYNTYPETLRYLDSLTPFATDNIAVILADNSDMEKPPEFLEKIKDAFLSGQTEKMAKKAKEFSKPQAANNISKVLLEYL